MDEASLTPAKVLLLAVHLTAHGDLDGLTKLTCQNAVVLHNQLLLRILLTHMPETARPDTYVPFLQCLAEENLVDPPHYHLDLSPVEHLSDGTALKKAKRLHLVSLTCSHAPREIQDDPICLFLYIRAHNMDIEAGILSQLPDLLTPFLVRSRTMSVWATATVLPFVKRTTEYFIGDATICSLADFEMLHDRQAAKYLLPYSVASGDAVEVDVSQYLRSMVAPWLYDEERWLRTPTGADESDEPMCEGWDEVLKWLLLQASKPSSRVPRALESWKGPGEDVDFGRGSILHLPDPCRRHLHRTLVRAAMACVYIAQDCDLDSLGSLYNIGSSVQQYLGASVQETLFEESLSQLPNLLIDDDSVIRGAKAIADLRSDLLARDNILTQLCPDSATCLLGVTLSAAVFARLGVHCTARRAADLTFLHDEREQKAELTKLMRSIAIQAQRGDDSYLLTARHQVIWLHSWSTLPRSSPGTACFGPLSALSQEHIEIEFLKLLLSGNRQ